MDAPGAGPVGVARRSRHVLRDRPPSGRAPRLVADVVAAGHAVANHTYTHRLLPAATPWRIHEEIRRATDAIAPRPAASARGSSVLPGGAWSREVLAQCAAQGLRPLDWSVDPGTGPGRGTSSIVSTIMSRTRPGSIILEHAAAVTAHRPWRRSASRCPGCSIRATGSSSPADRVEPEPVAAGARADARGGRKPASGRREPPVARGSPAVAVPESAHVRPYPATRSRTSPGWPASTSRPAGSIGSPASSGSSSGRCHGPAGRDRRRPADVATRCR